MNQVVVEVVEVGRSMDCFGRLRVAGRDGTGRCCNRRSDDYSSMLPWRWKLWKL